MSRCRDNDRVVGALVPCMLLILHFSSGCADRAPTEPRFCWMGIDTLYASGIGIADTADVHRAFDEYIAFVDTTAAEFPCEEAWRYLNSEPFDTWRGQFYWQVEHEAYSSELGQRLARRLIYVDANGNIVWPYGCF